MKFLDWIHFDIDNRWHVRAYITISFLLIALGVGVLVFITRVAVITWPWTIYLVIAGIAYLWIRDTRRWLRKRNG